MHYIVFIALIIINCSYANDIDVFEVTERPCTTLRKKLIDICIAKKGTDQPSHRDVVNCSKDADKEVSRVIKKMIEYFEEK